MQGKKILFINTETSPYVNASPLATLGKIVPEAVQATGSEIRTFMPKWGCINERRGQLHEVIRLSGMNIIVNDTDHPLIIKVASIPVSRVQVYFIDNDDYFTRKGIANDEQGNPYPDNGERAIFFARGVLETVKKLRWTPDIICCQGWMSAIVPLFIKKAYNEEPCFRDCKVISSLYHSDISGFIGKDFKNCLQYKNINADMLKDYSENFDVKELGKLAIDYSDGIIQMSENVNPELLSHAASKNIPLLSYPGEDFIEAYKNFYNSL